MRFIDKFIFVSRNIQSHLIFYIIDIDGVKYMKKVILTKTECNQIYNNMKNRCYNEKVHEMHPHYIGCAMCDEWLNDKYTFYNWVNDGNFYVIDGEPTIHLDKDILVKGNKIYSPETCIFVPASVNNLFGGLHSKQDGLPIGVVKTKNGKYRPNIKGFKDEFYTQEEAFEIYKRHTEAKIIREAEYYLGKTPMKLYYAMMDYKIEITD